MHCSLYLEIGHQSKKQIRHRWTCRCSSLDPSPERPSPCLKSHLNNFPFLKNHLKFGNQMQKQVLFTTICETDDMRRTFITCPMFSPVRTNPAAVSKPFFHRNIHHYIPFKQLKKLGVTCKLWKINPLTLKPRKIIMWKHHDLAYGSSLAPFCMTINIMVVYDMTLTLSSLAPHRTSWLLHLRLQKDRHCGSLDEKLCKIWSSKGL